METRANYLIVGLFTLAVITAGFVFVWWFSRPAEHKVAATYEVIYEGNVAGLRQGSWVTFNGIRVGEVRDLRLHPSDPRKVIATITVQDGVLVRSDTKAGLEHQGLTGVAAVSLTGGAPDAPPVPLGPDKLPRLAADPSSVQDLMAVARRIAGQAETAIERIDRLIADNQADVRTMVSNAAKFSEALGRNSGKVDGIMADASDLARKLNGVADRIDKVLSNVEGLTGSGEGQGLMAEFTATARSVRELAERLDKRTAELTNGLSRFTGAGLREFEQMATEGRRTLADFDRALRNFERNPSGFIFGGGGGGVPSYSGRR